MMNGEKTLEDLGHFRGEVSSYKCDRCGGPMAYLSLGRDRGFTRTLYALYIKCTDCGAGDIANHYEDNLRSWPAREPDLSEP